MKMKNKNENSKCFGFVNFQSPNLIDTIGKLNGTITNDENILFIGWTQRKYEKDKIERLVLSKNK